MRKVGWVLALLLTTGLAPALGQDIPVPPVGPDEDWAAYDAWANRMFPSAKVCGECHPKQFYQWSNSSHAYASLSPMFNKFEQTINNLSNGTINYFCVRCHASVGTNLGESRETSLWMRSQAAREGITCITCHRVGEAYGKNNAARRITPGDIHEPVFGPFDGDGVLKATGNARRYGVLVSTDQAAPEEPPPGPESKWLRIHQYAIESDFMSESQFCVACHQVQVHPGIKLETVWEEYRASPAVEQGITCQECHMSTSPGRPTGYARGAAAIVNGKTVHEDRPLADHTFVGPGYPISHPGLFPISQEPERFTPDQWLTFDYRAGWGSSEFEKQVAADPEAYDFCQVEPEFEGKPPPCEPWKDAANRKIAWRKVQANLDRWEERRQMRQDLLENASHLDGPFFDGRLAVGQPLKFRYELTNVNPGHNLPSGSLGAQPQVWLNVALVDPDGNNVWESGYLDSMGDLSDLQSTDRGKGNGFVHDDQLFTLQSKFLTSNIKGTDREMYLPINLDFDQRAFIRPGNAPVSLLNHPQFARLEKRSLPPMATRAAKYKVPGKLITKPGTYKLAVRLRSRSEPIYFMSFVGSTTDMIRLMNDWITDTHEYAVEFDVR